MTLQRPPASVQDTAIYRKIVKPVADPDGLHGKASRFIELANPLLDSVGAGPFATYTLHNRDHARKLLHIAEYIVAPETLQTLTRFECLLFLYAAYLHDMGMAVSHAELHTFASSEALTDVLNTWPQLNSTLTTLRERHARASDTERPHLDLAIFDAIQVAATHHFRPLHATPDRYRTLLLRLCSADGGNDLFRIRGVSFEEELIDICASHNLGPVVLGELRTAHVERFERKLTVAGHLANAQFVAALLRLTDVLDFDFERTPRVLFDSLGLRHRSLPGSDVSLREWEKHLAVQQLDIRETELLVRARCKHPAIEAAVRQFALIIEEEIRTTLSVLARNSGEIADRYRFRLPNTVRCDVRSDGYKFLDIALSLDEAAVMSLLMGTSLYRTPHAAVRELIQNSVDACKVLRSLSPGLDHGGIEITDFHDDEGRHWISVRDAGVGMDEYILRSYFLKVGRSFYSSIDFERLLRTSGATSPALSSRFGIGFLASFMLADLVEIETLPAALHGQPRSSTALRVSIERLGAIAYVQEINSSVAGTTVKLRVRTDLGDCEKISAEIFDYVRSTIVRSVVPISVSLAGRELQISSDTYFGLVERPRSPDGVQSDHFHVIQISIEKYSNILSGRVFLAFVLRDDGKTLDVRLNGRLLSLEQFSVKGRITIPLHYLFNDFTGNRVTVGGVRI